MLHVNASRVRGGPAVSSEINSMERWRALAAEALDIAKQLTDPIAKQAMIAIAEKYMELAERAEGRSREERAQVRPSAGTLATVLP